MSSIPNGAFEWDKVLERTKDLIFKGHVYYISVAQFQENMRVDLIEDEKIAKTDNTSNETFCSIVDTSLSIDSQIIDWGMYLLIHNLKECDHCHEEKIINEVEQYDREYPDFDGLTKICCLCREILWRSISKKLEAERRKDNEAFEQQLKLKPPIIVGGFNTRFEALKAIDNLECPDVEELGDGFINAKGILTASDGTYYPALFTICTIDGGEHWDTLFITENLDFLIPQQFINPYLCKSIENLFPYDYETISIIDGDFHQNHRFGKIFISEAQHHTTNVIHPLEGNFVDGFSVVQIRPYFSIQHIQAASNFVDLCKEIEERGCILMDDGEVVKYRAYVTGSILLSTAFLEATINEVFSDAKDYPEGVVRDLHPETLKTMKLMWEHKVPRTAHFSILEKYQIALTLAGKPLFEPGSEPYQSVDLLIKLRNGLTHYEPSWISLSQDGSTKKEKFESKLRGKFALNPYTGPLNPFFPDKCLGYGCAQWAVISSLRFTDEFFSKIGLISMYQHIKSTLSRNIIGKM